MLIENRSLCTSSEHLVLNLPTKSTMYFSMSSFCTCRDILLGSIQMSWWVQSMIWPKKLEGDLNDSKFENNMYPFSKSAYVDVSG